MSTQQIVGVLKKAGYQAQRITRTENRPGFQVAKIGRAAGVLCGPYPVEEVSRALMDAGYAVSQQPNTATDALFVG